MGTGFAEKLETALKEKGMTQKELAQKANITESAVSHYVKGDREPRGGTVGAIAAVLGVTAGFLLGAGVASAVKDADRQTFEGIRELVKQNRDKLDQEQRLELIRLLSDLRG